MMTGRTFWVYTTVTLASGAAGGALMIQLATGVAMAAKPAARTLTAQRLVLTDLDGRKRIVIGVAPDGAAKMAKYDNDGRERAQRKGRMVVCGREHRRAAGRENRDAAESDARRTEDRDAPGGGRATANLRCGN